MKRKYLLFSLLLILVGICGCTMNNTPTKKVEALLMKYQNNSDNITTELDDYLKTLNVDETNYNNYKKVYLKQYQDLKYTVKDEKIDGDKATVTTQIEVYDYYKTENNVTSYIASHTEEFSDNGVYSTSKGIKYKVDELNKTKDRVTYTIDFELSKVNDTWTINTLTDEELEKIHGTYAH